MVGGYRSDHAYGVHFGGPENFVFVRGERNRGVHLAEPLSGLQTVVADQDDFGLFLGVKIPDDVRSPVTISENTDANHRFLKVMVAISVSSIPRHCIGFPTPGRSNSHFKSKPNFSLFCLEAHSNHTVP